MVQECHMPRDDITSVADLLFQMGIGDY